MNRWGNLIREERQGRTIHQTGLPGTLGGSPEALPRSTFLLIEERQEGFFLIRNSASHEFAGDTWHQTLDEAMDQAKFEFGDALTRWMAIPSEEPDPITYIRRKLADSR